MLVYAFDVVNQAIVSFNGSSISLNSFRQGRFPAKIYLVKPKPNFATGQSSAYEGYDPRDDDFDGLRVGFWKDSTGTLSDSDPNKLALTDQLGWTFDPDTDPDAPFFYGYIDLSLEVMANWIADAKSKGCYFAVNLVAGAALSPVFDQKGSANSIVYAATDDGIGAGVDMLDAIPIINLPCKFKAANGHIYLIEENVTQDGIIFNRTV